MSDRIILSGMRFYGYHGVLPEETRLGQAFSVDVEMELDLQEAGQTDDLSKTVDYSQVFELAKRIVEGRPLRLIEAVAERIAADVLDRHPVREVLVRVHKPGAPIPGSFDGVAVEVRRRRPV